MNNRYPDGRRVRLYTKGVCSCADETLDPALAPGLVRFSSDASIGRLKCIVAV